MKVKVIAVGKLKEKYLKDGIAEYGKRMSRFVKFEIVELADEKTPDNASAAQNRQIMEKEGERILAKISERDYVIVLVIEGKQLSPEAFSQVIADATLRGYSDIVFVIGESLGLADKVKKRVNLRLSSGLLILPHQLMCLVLLEQIYRAFITQQGGPYHKQFNLWWYDKRAVKELIYHVFLLLFLNCFVSCETFVKNKKSRL